MRDGTVLSSPGGRRGDVNDLGPINVESQSEHHCKILIDPIWGIPVGMSRQMPPKKIGISAGIEPRILCGKL